MSFARRATESSGSYYFPASSSFKDSSLKSLWPNSPIEFPKPSEPQIEPNSTLAYNPIDRNVFVRRYSSLNQGHRKEKYEWSADSVIKSTLTPPHPPSLLYYSSFFTYLFPTLICSFLEYPSDRTIELYDFPSEFETADINLALEKYQHGNTPNGGYRIKWLNDTRALVVFRKPDLVPTAVSDFQANPLIKARIFEFKESDLSDFNHDVNNNSSTSVFPANPPRKTSYSDQIPLAMNIDLEAIQKRYRSDLSLELSDFSKPMETSDLLEILSPYRKNGHIVRIKWFNKNRAIAWFSDPALASQAIQDNESNPLLNIKPYSFLPADIKYFTQDVKLSPLDNIESKNKHYSFNNGVTASRRNTVSGSSGYVRRPYLPSRLQNIQ
ncbi:Coiled-coil domain-containing protein R3HCC1L [Smittium culicis]|uniref:Coiled-coil domain-containing protein R3HCC1L n=1 Tax=Smittium culicis TaxID=133412 RepID=A0A1R1XTI8_9FUNG|nr:Coiled-coil domain-containing protein R3HCC1L [Smittium culicis]